MRYKAVPVLLTLFLKSVTPIEDMFDVGIGSMMADNIAADIMSNEILTNGQGKV